MVVPPPARSSHMSRASRRSVAHVVADVRPGGSEGGGHESRVVGGLGRDAEVLQDVVERRRTTSVIEPRVVEEDSVVEL